MTEHRKKLSKQFDFCSLQHQGILNQLLGKEKRNESSKKDIVSRINQWKKRHDREDSLQG